MKPYIPRPEPDILASARTSGKRIPPQPEPSPHFAQLRQQHALGEREGNIWACAFLILAGSIFLLGAILTQVH